jgi:glucokinase
MVRGGRPVTDCLLGVDIGGTKIASGLFSPQGRLLARHQLPTEDEKGFSYSSQQMFTTIDLLLEQAAAREADVTGIGVCAPGPIEAKKGILYNPPNLTGWENLNLKALLESRYGKRVYVDNDANAAGLAEALWGAAIGYENIFYVTVSTGIGTGIILNRKIYHGKNGMAGEGGHMTIRYDSEDFKCKCGNIGCIEAYASGSSVAERARKRLKDLPEKPALLSEIVQNRWNTITMKDLSRAAMQGDHFCQEMIRETGLYLGIWLGSVISILDPDIIVIGGGVARIGEPLFEVIRREIPARTINRCAAHTPVVKAALQEDVGIYGAAALAL